MLKKSLLLSYCALLALSQHSFAMVTEDFEETKITRSFNGNPLLDLPEEVWIQIFQYLPPKKAIQLGCLSKQSEKISVLSIRSLDLTRNTKITNEVVYKLLNLTDLNLFDNKTITNEGICHLIHLRSLNLYYNLKITDEGIKFLTNLRSLDLGVNEQITDEGIKFLTNLTELGLKNNKIITNEGIHDLINLRSLKLVNNQRITSKGIKLLSNLTELNLADNWIITNEGIHDLINLRSLNLFRNEHISNEGIKGLFNLTSLDIRSNRNITFEGIKGLTNLTELECDDSNVSASAVQQHLPNFRYSFVVGNSLSVRLEKEPVQSKGLQLDLDLQPTGNAQSITKVEEGITVVTDNNNHATYQLVSNRFKVAMGQEIRVFYSITVEKGGIMSLGLLNTARNGWYGDELILKTGHYEDVYSRIVPAGETETSLVFRNYQGILEGGPGQSTFTIHHVDYEVK